MHKNSKSLVIATAVIALGGCAGLHNTAESIGGASAATELPAFFNGAEGAQAGAADLQTRQWWATFDDPSLSQIVSQTLLQNLSWEAAKTRVLQAQAVLAQRTASQSPQIDLGAGVTRQRRSLEVANLPSGAGGVGSGSGSGQTAPRDTTVWSADAQLRWQWDAFGELKSAQNAAAARVVQSRAAAVATQLLVASQAATAVVQARALRQRMLASQAALVVDIQQLEIAMAKRRAGLISEAPVQQAQAVLETSHQTVAQLASEFN